MLLSFYKGRSRAHGFTLIELMIVVAIVGILAAIAVPNFIAYRNKSRVAATVGSLESVRAALAAFAADSVGNSFPDGTITTYATLVPVVNDNGATLKATEPEQGFQNTLYTGIDADGDGIFENYTMTVDVLGIADGKPGRTITVTPSGIEKSL